MNIDIYKINQLGDNIFNIIKPELKKSFKKISSEIETVYIYRDLQMIIDNMNNKTCYRYEPKELKRINKNYILNTYELKTVSLSLFPYLEHYDDQYERIRDKCVIDNNEFEIVKENETLYFKIKNNDLLDKFIKEIA